MKSVVNVKNEFILEFDQDYFLAPDAKLVLYRWNNILKFKFFINNILSDEFNIIFFCT